MEAPKFQASIPEPISRNTSAVQNTYKSTDRSQEHRHLRYDPRYQPEYTKHRSLNFAHEQGSGL